MATATKQAPKTMKPYHLGWYRNRYADWYHVEHFAEPIDLVRWLMVHAADDGAIDFISYKE